MCGFLCQFEGKRGTCHKPKDIPCPAGWNDDEDGGVESVPDDETYGFWERVDDEYARKVGK